MTDTPPEAADEHALVEALERIEQWADAYPRDIFQEPNLEAVKALLAANDMLVEMDRMHASWARHLTEGIGGIARAALAAARPDGEREAVVRWLRGQVAQGERIDDRLNWLIDAIEQGEQGG